MRPPAGPLLRRLLTARGRPLALLAGAALERWLAGRAAWGALAAALREAQAQVAVLSAQVVALAGGDPPPPASPLDLAPSTTAARRRS